MKRDLGDLLKVIGGREGNIPRIASESHFTYFRQCASPGLPNLPQTVFRQFLLKTGPNSII